MKHLLHYAILAAFTAAMAACSSDDNIDTGGQTPGNGAVKTQFAITIPGANGSATRMTEANTQQGANPSFLGMSDIYLLSYIGSPSQSGTFKQTTKLTDLTTLPDVGSAGKIYSDVEVEPGVDNFLFYAMGPAGEKSSNTDTRPEKGTLTSVITANTNGTSSITFTPTAILDQTSKTSYTQEMTKRVNYLNGIANATGFYQSQDLASIYARLALPGKDRSVASADLKTWMQDLYTALVAAETGASAETQAVITAVKTAITTATDGFFTADATTKTLSWAMDAEQTFPTNLGLPNGTATVTCSMKAPAAATQTEAAEPFSSTQAETAVGTGSKEVNVNNIVYPACLVYRANTELRETSDTPTDANFWPTSLTDWDGATASGGKFASWGKFVRANTQAVALVNPVLYGVAALKTSVKIQPKVYTTDGDGNTASSDADKLKDANGDDVTVPTDGFKLTGVLVGGQPSAVDWECVKTTAGKFENTVYDSKMNGDIYAKKDATSAYNYTLLLDNYSTANSGQESPKMVIELQNDNDQSAQFTGLDGVIMPGQKFYLVAELDPAKASSTASNDFTKIKEAYRYPGYDTSKATDDKLTHRVFMQDFTTEVNLLITSFKNAYVTIPDLRSVNLKLGLAVDIKWKTGLTFSAEIQ